MSVDAFATAEVNWHDFFLAVAGASAALLGLLFVGVSINLSTISGDERVDLRVRAGQAFANLNFVLVIALIMLIPRPDPSSIAIALALVALLGGVRVVQNVRAILRGRSPREARIAAARRIGWTAVADVVLAYTAWRIWAGTDAGVIENLVTVVIVLMIGAADVSWAMLVEVSADARG